MAAKPALRAAQFAPFQQDIRAQHAKMAIILIPQTASNVPSLVVTALDQALVFLVKMDIISTPLPVMTALYLAVLAPPLPIVQYAQPHTTCLVFPAFLVPLTVIIA